LGCFFGLGFELFVDCGEKRLEMVKNGVKWCKMVKKGGKRWKKALLMNRAWNYLDIDN